MFKKSKSIIAILLVVIMLFNADMAMAVSFTDVNKTDENSWAYDYIIELANKNIINGYEDGSYKPASNVRYLEVLKLIDGIVSPAAAERTEAKVKYGSLVTELGISDWAKPAVELALYRNIATETELKDAKNAGFLLDAATKFIDRKTISIFMARALELSPKANPNLTYKDKDQLSSDEAQLIAALIDTGVLHKDGRDGNFEGKAPVKRSEVAKMFKYAYDWVAKNPLKGSKTENVKAEIIYYLPQGDVKNLAYKEEGKKQEIVKLDSSTKIYDKAGKELKFADLEKLTGATINLEYRLSGTDKFAVSIKVVTDANVKSGDVYLYQSYKKINDKSFELTITDLDGKNSRTVESIFDEVIVNGKEVELKELKKDTRIKLEYLDGKVVRIVVAEPTYEIVDFSETDLKVRNLSKNTNESFFISSNVKVTRDGKDISKNLIKKGDMVDLTFDGNLVSRIDIYAGSNTYYRDGEYKFVSYYSETSSNKGYIIVEDSYSKRHYFDLAKGIYKYYDGSQSYSLSGLDKNSYIKVGFNRDGDVDRIDLVSASSDYQIGYYTRNGDVIRLNGKSYYVDADTKIIIGGRGGYSHHSYIPESGYARIDVGRNNKLVRIEVDTDFTYSDEYRGIVTKVTRYSNEKFEITVRYDEYSWGGGSKTGRFITSNSFAVNDRVKVYVDSRGEIVNLEYYR